MLVGLTGVGGGSLMTPVLVLLFGFHPATAVGTDLLYASVTKTVGTAVHGKRQTVDWRHRRALATGSVPGGGRHLVRHEPLGKMSGSASGVLNLLLGAALLLTGVAVLFRAGDPALVEGHVGAMDKAAAVAMDHRARLRPWACSCRSPRSAPGRSGRPRC